jgi:DNA-binding SARP family transcriptional activator
MNASLSAMLSILTLILGVGLAVYVLVRRPRQPSSWLFGGAVLGFVAFYMGNLILLQPGLTAAFAFEVQRIQILFGSAALICGLFLATALAEPPIPLWVRLIQGAVILRTFVDTLWILSLQPLDPPACTTPLGYPQLTCPPGDRLGIVSGLISVLLLIGLFLRTALTASGQRRRILMRSMGLATVLALSGSLVNHIVGLTGRLLLPGQIPALLGGLVWARMLLQLEEQEVGPAPARWGKLALAVFAALAVALALDVLWSPAPLPVFTLLVLTASAVASLALAIRISAQAAAVVAAKAEAAPFSGQIQTTAQATPATNGVSVPADTPRLRLYLFGAMRVERDGQPLPNSTEVWRSAKTRSLLAYLALRGKSGTNQTEIVNALWPPKAELDGTAEQRSLASFRSYLSTLRHVLEPDGPRGSQRYVQQAGARYFLRRSPGVWVDVWQFDDLAAQAERQWAAGQQEAAVACWEEALALYAPEGLLIDEEHMDSTVLEPMRERLRQTWLLGLRRLVKVYAEQGQRDRADELRRTWRAAQRFGQE